MSSIPGLVVKTVTEKSTVYDATIGKFIAGSNEDFIVTSCGSTVKVFSPSSSCSSSAKNKDNSSNNKKHLLSTHQVDGTILNMSKISLATFAQSVSSSHNSNNRPQIPISNDADNHNAPAAAAASSFSSTNNNNNNTAGGGDCLVAVLEKMQLIFFRFTKDQTSDGSITPLFLGSSSLASAVALRADNGNMIFTADYDRGIIAVHAQLRHLQLFFVERAKETTTTTTSSSKNSEQQQQQQRIRQRSPEADQQPRLVSSQCSIRLAEHQVIDMKFLNPTTTITMNNNNKTSSSSSSTSQLVILYRDRSQAVHVSSYTMGSTKETIALQSKALVSHLERTALFLVPFSSGEKSSLSSAQQSSFNGFAVCGATQATLVSPPSMSNNNNQQSRQDHEGNNNNNDAEEDALLLGDAAATNTTTTKKQSLTSKQLAQQQSRQQQQQPSSFSQNQNQQQQQSHQQQPWTKTTIGYYPETPSRISFDQIPSTATSALLSVSSNNSSNNNNTQQQQRHQQKEEYIIVMLQNGSVIFVDAQGKSKRGAPASVYLNPNNNKSFITNASAIVPVPNNTNNNSSNNNTKNIIGIFSTTSSSILTSVEIKKTTSSSSNNNNSKNTASSTLFTPIFSSTSSPPTLLIENDGPILGAAISSSSKNNYNNNNNPTTNTELLTICGAATEAVFNQYRTGATLAPVATIPSSTFFASSSSYLQSVHSAGDSTAVLLDSTASSLRMLSVQLDQDKIEEVEGRTDVVVGNDEVGVDLVLSTAMRKHPSVTVCVTSNSVKVSSSNNTNNNTHQNSSSSSSSSWNLSSSSSKGKITAASLEGEILVVAHQGGQFTKLNISIVNNSNNTTRIEETASFDFSSVVVTCPALALSADGNTLFFGVWGTPSIYVVSSLQQKDANDEDDNTSLVKKAPRLLCKLPNTSLMVRSCAVLSSSSAFLVVVGTPSGDVYCISYSNTNNNSSSFSSSSSSSPSSGRMYHFSTGSTPVSCLTKISPMTFPPTKTKRASVFCCGDSSPCFVTIAVSSNNNNTNNNIIEPEIIHIATNTTTTGGYTSVAELLVSSPASSASSHNNNNDANNDLPTLALVASKSKDLIIAKPVTDSLLQKTKILPHHHHNHNQSSSSSTQHHPAASHVTYVASKKCFVVGTLPSLTSLASVSILGSNAMVNNNSNRKNKSSSTFFNLFENEICASVECLNLAHQKHFGVGGGGGGGGGGGPAPASSSNHQQHHRNNRPAFPLANFNNNNINYTNNDGSSSSSAIAEYLVVATRRLGGESKAGGRLLFFQVVLEEEGNNNNNDSSNQNNNNNTSTSTYPALHLITECDVTSSSIGSMTSAFGHRLLIVAGGSAFVYSLLLQQPNSNGTNADLLLQQQQRAGEDAAAVAAAGASSSNNNNNQYQNQMMTMINIVPELSVRVSLCCTSVSASCPRSNVVFIGDALHSVAAIRLKQQRQYSSSSSTHNNNTNNNTDGNNNNNNNNVVSSSKYSVSESLVLHAREVARRRILSVLALPGRSEQQQKQNQNNENNNNDHENDDDETSLITNSGNENLLCLASDEAMNISLLQIIGKMKPNSTNSAGTGNNNNNNRNNNNDDNDTNNNQQSGGGRGGDGNNNNNNNSDGGLEKCNLMICLASWHIGDRITVLCRGSALSGGYSHGKDFLMMMNNNSNNNNNNQEFFEDHQNENNVDHGSSADNNNKDSQSRALISSSSRVNNNNNDDMLSSSLLQQTIIAGTTCGSLLSIALVDDKMRTFLASLCQSLLHMQPDNTRIIVSGKNNGNLISSSGNTESLTTFRNEHSYDAHPVTAMSNEDNIARNSSNAIDPSSLFIDGDEISRLVKIANEEVVTEVLNNLISSIKKNNEFQENDDDDDDTTLEDRVVNEDGAVGGVDAHDQTRNNNSRAEEKNADDDDGEFTTTITRDKKLALKIFPSAFIDLIDKISFSSSSSSSSSKKKKYQDPKIILEALGLFCNLVAPPIVEHEEDEDENDDGEQQQDDQQGKHVSDD